MVKFFHFKFSIIDLLPRANKLKRITVSQPVFYDVGCAAFTLFGIGHVGERNVILIINWQDGDFGISDFDFCHVVLLMQFIN